MATVMLERLRDAGTVSREEILGRAAAEGCSPRAIKRLEKLVAKVYPPEPPQQWW